MPTPVLQLLSQTQYSTDGSTTVWDFSFSGGYLDKSHVKAFIETPTGLRTPIIVTESMLIGQFQLQITPALPNGNLLVIYRDTPKDLPLVDFADEAGLSEIALDTNAKQAVFIAAESTDTTNQLNVGAAIEAQQDAAISAASALADRIQTGLDRAQTTSDRVVAVDSAATAVEQADIATTKAGLAIFAADSAVAALTFYGPNPPAPTLYKRWISSEDFREYIYLNDGDSSQWAEIAGPTNYQFGSGDAEYIPFQPGLPGAVSRSIASKLRESISVKDFGAVGDGVTDDTAAIQAAVDSFGSTGGVINMVGKYSLASNLIVKPNVFLVGHFNMPGRSTSGSGAATDYSAVGSGSLRLAPTATIFLQGGAGLQSLLVYRAGMAFPATPATTFEGFAGTAVTVTGDDASVRSCMIMGFNKAIYSGGVARLRVDYLYHDNINGVEITDCNDIPYLTNCHAWPFATIVTGQSWQNLIRPGTAYYIHDFVDWARLTNCFSYGYAVGFKISDANSTILTTCGADNVHNGAPLHSGSIGYVIQQICYETKLIGCQAAAQDTAGVFINVASGLSSFITDQSVWGGRQHGVLIQNGDVIINGGSVRGVNNGITLDDNTSKVIVNGATFADILELPVNSLVFNTDVQIKGCNFTNYEGAPIGGTGSLVAPTITSAASVLLPNNGEVFTIAGNSSFGTLQHGWVGRQVTLVFSGVLTVFNGAGSPTNIKLLNGGNLTTGPGSVLKLSHNGVQWYEVGRS